jgi:hypothetical protein
MKIKSFKNFIVTDWEGKPMVFHKPSKQLVYCNDEFYREDICPIKKVSEQQGREQIEKTIKFRTENGYDVGKYKLMPISI